MFSKVTNGNALLVGLVSLSFLVSFSHGQSLSHQEIAPVSPTSSPSNTESYHTPLAGAALDIEIAGEKLNIPAHDRRHILAVNLGTALFFPRIGNHTGVPFFALYYKGQWEDDRRRARAVVTGVVNYVDFEDGSWNNNGWEVLGHWENYTIPFPTTEIVEGEEIKFSEIYWGHFLGGLGIGWRAPVYPYHCDNDFRWQIWYEPGFIYSRRSSNTGPEVQLPPDTPLHQLHLRVRLDTFERNILELPHRGWACGIDFTLGRREHWADHQFTKDITFSRENTRDFLRLTSYVMTAVGIPSLSERHRLLFSCYAGWSPAKNWDRFSALRIGGGPSPSESNDLSRNPFPGALFDQFIVERYLIMNIEYRLEIMFFLYLHLRGTFAWGKVASLDDGNRLSMLKGTAQAFSCGITSGFIWDSLIYLEYAYDHGVVRPNDQGHGFLISWAKDI